jgi:hypothetical protein
MFSPLTKPKIVSILSIEITQQNADELGTLLSAIEVIDSGNLVAPIESLIAQIESVQAIASSPASLKLNGMIKADVVEWQKGQGASSGVAKQLAELKNQLRAMLGIARSNAASGGVTMMRSDRYSLTGYGSTYTDWRFLAW